MTANARIAIVDLIEALQGIVDTYGDTATLGAVHQPHYPIRLEVVGVATTGDMSDADVIDDDAGPFEDDADRATVRQRAEADLPTAWLVLDQPSAHDVNPYPPAALWEVMEPFTA